MLAFPQASHAPPSNTFADQIEAKMVSNFLQQNAPAHSFSLEHKVRILKVILGVKKNAETHHPESVTPGAVESSLTSRKCDEEQDRLCDPLQQRSGHSETEAEAHLTVGAYLSSIAGRVLDHQDDRVSGQQPSPRPGNDAENRLMGLIKNKSPFATRAG
ncbi:hypothetical protein CC86DRAFT_160464 [Ophiobolus disseminans]|uniref:Uncharacterized protein n=1 Tax=Ophiobolus disseminans TaxID=1469910 RepID=A0A6A7ACP4_9PLEO|nr:hypothetical protein CC86DRAFT_160464 [Ophiobolus disseminans]